jgi:LmbE family N-acetylglucosaminyl deacetylase
MSDELKFRSRGSLIYVPDPTEPSEALARTTHLGIVAHQDDLEIAAFHGVWVARRDPSQRFSGVTLAQGTGGPRAPELVDASEALVSTVRREEQMYASDLGTYSAHVFLDYASSVVKDLAEDGPTLDLVDVLRLTRPRVVYTHALSDRHSTHLATALRTIYAIRALPAEERPEQILGCEVWGDLDWLPEPYRIELDVSGEDDLARELISAFKSQIAAGKRYDIGTLGRRAAHATFGNSHTEDQATALTLAMNLSPLIAAPELDIEAFLAEMLNSFQSRTLGNLRALLL